MKFPQFKNKLSKLVRNVLRSGHNPDLSYCENWETYYQNIIDLIEFMIIHKENLPEYLKIQYKNRLCSKSKNEINLTGCRIDFIQLYQKLKMNPLTLKWNMMPNISDVEKYPGLAIYRKNIKNLHISVFSEKKIEPDFGVGVDRQPGEEVVKPQTTPMIPSIPLPFCNKLNPNKQTCCAIIRHYGLYVQCIRNSTDEGDYCQYCLKKGIKYGNIKERMNNPQWVCSYNNEKPVHYQVVRDRFNISQKKAREAAQKMGWTISAEQLKGNGKRGRKPSRKVKIVEVVEECDYHDDIIKRLIEDAIEVCSEDEAEEEENDKQNDNDNDDDDEEEEEVEIEVSEITIGDITYYIDDDKILYDSKTHDEIGKYKNGRIIKNE